MKVELKKVDERTFDEIDALVLFNDSITSRNFCVISNQFGQRFKFAWQSDLITPEIINVRENTFGVGIDLNYSIIDFSTGMIILNIVLPYFFIASELDNNWLFVASELEVIKIDKTSFKKIKRYNLPSLFEKIVHDGDKVQVICEDEFIVDID